MTKKSRISPQLSTDLDLLGLHAVEQAAQQLVAVLLLEALEARALLAHLTEQRRRGQGRAAFGCGGAHVAKKA